jgi:hypothetical protein
MCLTTMVDLQCVGFGAKGEPGAEMVERRLGRGWGLHFRRGGERAQLDGGKAGR